jgi:enamine deaminase RidA (YjgF/YER057c/UK114 family)|tara:strand:+ start:167 stop:628 length:462 start_codon:yes stop_codon:yes gene_type:complete
MSIKDKLQSLNIDLSNPPKAVGSYVAFKKIDKFIYISGQLPINNEGVILKGKVGDGIDLEKAQNAANICGINILKQLNQATNYNLDTVKNCIKITGYVNSIEKFNDQPKVINPVSELLVNIFGEVGKHTRVAVSVNSLPLGAIVEVDGLFEIK